jgi:hypothetical protein
MRDRLEKTASSLKSSPPHRARRCMISRPCRLLCEAAQTKERAGHVDRFDRHPKDYLVAFEELAQCCSLIEELSEEAPANLYM